MRINDLLLPVEVQNIILSYLTPKQLAQKARVSKLWKEMAKTLFKRHYFALPFPPIKTNDWQHAYAEKMKIISNIHKLKMQRIPFRKLSLHQKREWIEKVKKDTVLPITEFGDYFSYPELNAIRINGIECQVLDSHASGTLALVSQRIIYYSSPSGYSLTAPSGYTFKASLKAVILDPSNFVIPALDSSSEMQIFRVEKAVWKKWIFIGNSHHFKILYNQNRLILQISETEVRIYELDKTEVLLSIRLDEPLRFLKAQHGLLHIFSGSNTWQAYDLETGKLAINTCYRVKNPRFITQRKFTQIISRNIIGYKTNRIEICELDLPEHSKIIKAIWAESLIIFCFACRDSYCVDGYDVIKKEQLYLWKKRKELIFPALINIFYENGYLLCHSRLFQIASLFNFRSRI